MESLYANVVPIHTTTDNVGSAGTFKFDIEVALEQQLGAVSLPFPQMDKSTSAICEFYLAGTCLKGNLCPFRHIRENRTVVCKHWLRGLCKKGDQCEFLHEFDMTKMPECYFYTRFNACHNKECPFLHIDPEAKLRECPWYMRGFCRHGPNCRHKHVRKVLCLNYLAGFCPTGGKECKFVHPSFELPQADDMKKNKAGIICHVCGEMGHKSFQCGKNPDNQPQQHQHQPMEIESSRVVGGGDEAGGSSSERPEFRQHHFQPGGHFPRPQYGMMMRPPRGGEDHQGSYQQHGGPPGHFPGPRRALEDVVCYKCGYKGHYANKCNKGHLAFLSHKMGPGQQPGGQPGQGYHQGGHAGHYRGGGGGGGGGMGGSGGQ